MTLFVHIVAGGLALVSGYVALYAAKGATLHRKAGMLFVYAMLTMGVLGTVLATRTGAWVTVNVSAGVLTSYLVITALTTVRPPAAGARWLHIGAMLVALAVGLTDLTFGFEAIAGGGKRNGIPAFPYLMFGVVGMLATIGDLRILRSGPLQGGRRLARHLWRMSFALYVAAMSFFIGQAKVIPKPIRIFPLLALPGLAVLVTMFYWMWRVRRKRSLRTVAAVTPSPVPALLPMILICALAPAALAQENPLSAYNKGIYGGLKQILLRSAEKMPEESYNFRPTEEVRTFGQLVGHVADAQYMFCSAVLGEKNPGLQIEKTKTSKADLIVALKDAFVYCDKAYNAMTDASGAEKVKIMGGDAPKFGALTINQMHATLHYGNMITYMRMKGIVPPSSDAEFMRQLRRP